LRFLRGCTSGEDFARRTHHASGRNVEDLDVADCGLSAAQGAGYDEGCGGGGGPQISSAGFDTIKLIAYRAETAMAGLEREDMARHDDTRSLMRQPHESSIDLVPDPQSKTLTVRLHHLAARVHDEVIAQLCEELTATGTVFQAPTCL
jgi:hypothetical protein